MAERTPNGPADLLADETPPDTTYTIDDEESPTKGSDPAGSNEREPSLITRLSTGAAVDNSDNGSITRKPSRHTEVALAEKTSKIMSDYQAYLSEIETEFPGSTEEGAEAAERNIASVREEHRYRDEVDSSFAPPAENKELYRGWSRESDGERMIHIDRGADELESGGRFGRGRATRVGSQKRVKRGIAMIVLVSVIVGLSMAISNKKKRESLPDWEAELAATEAQAEEMEKEKEMEKQQENHDEMAGPGFSDGVLSEEQSKEVASVAMMFQPTFYDRRTGWTGQTYVEALAFCQDKSGYKSATLRVCPYIAICPGGEGSRPISGHLNENGNQDIMTYGGSWMPVIDDPNDWVSIGSDNSCVKWSALHDGALPDWGTTGEGNEVNTRHLVCCNADAVESFEEDELKQDQEAEAVAVDMSSDASQMSAGANNGNVGGNFGIAMAEDAGFDMNQATQDEIAGIENEENLSAEDDAALPYTIAASKFKPVFFDRESWSGTTYYEAVSFCENKGNNLHVCPFQALCPAGIGEIPIRTFNPDDMLWIPVSDEENSWISATREQPCLPFKNQADWGNDKVQAEKMTEFLACCSITSDTAGMILGVADLTGTPATTAAEAIVADAISNAGGEADAEYEAQSEEFKQMSSKVYEDIAMAFEPVLFTREKGWTGQTYLEGMDFCASSSSTEERSVCSLAAICPLGKGQAPTMGTQDGPDGGFSWVPISDDPNAWVQVSSKDTCLTYAYINGGESPQWGLDGQDNEESTRFLYCCLTVPGTGRPPSEVSGSQPVESTATATPEPTPNPTPAPIPAPTPNPTGAAVTETASTGMTAEDENELYSASAQTYQPLTFDSTTKPAWTGQAYLEALQFCANIDSRVPCPYLAICPAGPGKSPSGGVKSGYVPLIEQPNSWVNIGPTDTCKTYTNIYGGPPDWGLTGNGDAENTPYVACCIDLEDDKSEETSEAENNASDEMILTETEQAVMDTFKPEWFGREAGYQGSSYLSAIDFCANVAGKSLCPMMAYCPNGDQPSLYLQLGPFDGEQWAPIQTETGDVDYVMIGTYNGDPDSTCNTYSDLTGIGVPSWGLDGASEDLKQEVLCCLDPTFSTHGVITPTVEEDLNIPVVQTEESPTLDDGSFDLEGAVNLDLEPVWLDEEDGWDGGSHDDAEAFCQQTVGKSLCPYAGICPHGPGQPVLGGHDVDFTTEGLQWAPVFGASNHWILLSQKGGNSATTCMSHTDLEGTTPDWGLSNARPWLKKHILCCNLINGY